MSRIIKGKLVAGWNVAYPTIGTQGQFKATSLVRPDVVRLFSRLRDAERWCVKNDVGLEDMEASNAL